MASIKFSYQRLRKLPIILSSQSEGEDELEEEKEEADHVVRRNNSRSRWLRLRSSGGKRIRRRRRIRVVGLFLRRKVSGVVKKLMKTLKEGRPYLGEVFAGNYMFMQVTPTITNSNSKKYLNSNFLDNKYSFLPGGGQHHHVIATATAAAAAAAKFNINPSLPLS